MSAAPGRDLKLAIVGATGTVGARLVELIDERRFPYAELKLFASPVSSAQSVEGEEHEYPVGALRDPSELAAFDVAFLAVPEEYAAEIIKARPRPVLIDLSRAARAIANAPLVAPGLTPARKIGELAAAGLFAIPHPAAYAVSTLLRALDDRAEFAAVTIIVGASSGGRETMSRLIEQSADLMNARLEVPEGETQLAFNIFADRRAAEIAQEIASQVASLIGYAPSMVLQVAQAPTLHGTALVLCRPGSDATLRRKLREAPGLLLIEEDEGFHGVVDAVGEDAVVVRIVEQPAGVALWCTFDSARLTAISALWVAENLMPRIRSAPA